MIIIFIQKFLDYKVREKVMALPTPFSILAN